MVRRGPLREGLPSPCDQRISCSAVKRSPALTLPAGASPSSSSVRASTYSLGRGYWY